MSGLITKRGYQFDGFVKIPVDQGSPADRDVWIDSATGKLAFHIGGVDVLVPLASEIGGGGGFTQEQIEDFIALMFSDTSMFDWTYDDAAGSLSTVLKPDVVTNTELANMAQDTIKGRSHLGGTGDPIDLTPTQVKAILALVAADISDFTTAVRAVITVTDTSTVDLSWSSGVLTAAVLDSPLLGGQSKAQIQADIIAAISGGASAAYDTLIELQAILQNDDDSIAALTTAVGARARYFAGAIPSGAATANIDHNLGLTNIHDFIARIVVSSTGAEEEYSVVGSTGNRAIVTDDTGSNIAAGRRIFLVAGV